MLRLRTLGRFELIDREPPWARVVPAQPKRLALLAYLALAGSSLPVCRDRLIALFWPELGQARARLALRQALHHLRRSIGECGLVTGSNDRVGLAPGALWCDALAFEAAADGIDPSDALRLYEGDFLDAVFVVDAAPEFQEWVERIRMRLRRLAVRASWAMAEAAERVGDRSATARAAWQAYLLAPDDEDGVRRLLGIFGRLGDRAGALHVYDAYARWLAAECHATPAPETRALADALRGSDAAGDYCPPIGCEFGRSSPMVCSASEQTGWPKPLALTSLPSASLVMS